MKKGVRLRIAQHAACRLRASAAFLRDTNQGLRHDHRIQRQSLRA